jgi:hypothetical protein
MKSNLCIVIIILICLCSCNTVKVEGYYKCLDNNQNCYLNLSKGEFVSLIKKDTLMIKQFGNYKIYKKNKKLIIEFDNFNNVNEVGIKDLKKIKYYFLIVDDNYLNTSFDGVLNSSYKKINLNTINDSVVKKNLVLNSIK